MEQHVTLKTVAQEMEKQTNKPQTQDLTAFPSLVQKNNRLSGCMKMTCKTSQVLERKVGMKTHHTAAPTSKLI